MLPNFGILVGQFPTMRKNTSVSLGTYFDSFVEDQLSSGRYTNASEVIRAGLRLLEHEENKSKILKSAIYEGLSSSLVADFDFEENLKKLTLKD
jgi:antitoxin ParD1/3/4